MRYLNSETPLYYICQRCSLSGVKLWRDTNTFAPTKSLRCASCCLEEQKLSGPVTEEGKIKTPYGESDQIGCLVPAIPDEEGEGYWGYTSVPQAGVLWWKRLSLK